MVERRQILLQIEAFEALRYKDYYWEEIKDPIINLPRQEGAKCGLEKKT